MPSAGLSVFSNHAHLFQQEVFTKFTEIYKIIDLLTSHKNSDINKMAYAAFIKYMQTIATAIKNRADTGAQSCLNFLLHKLDAKMQSSGDDLRQLGLAVQSLGVIAASAKIIRGPDYLISIYTAIDKTILRLYADPLSVSQEAKSRTTSFIDGITHILFEYDECAPDIMTTLDILMSNTLNNFPSIAEKYQSVAVSAILNLLWVLESRFHSFCPFWSNFLDRVIVLSCTELPLSEDPDSTELDYSYIEYMPFWANIGRRETLTWFAFDKDKDGAIPRFFDNVFDEIIKALLLIPKKLALGTIEVENETEDCGYYDQKEMITVPINQRDIQIFYNYVAFCKTYLLECQNDQFKRRVSYIVERLIEFSKLYPNISGFYTLIQACFARCKQLQAFDLQIVGLKDYVTQVSVRLMHFKDELRVAGLSLLLSFPLEMVDFGVLKSELVAAFEIGLSVTPLAIISLEALESFVDNCDSTKAQEFCRHVLPSLVDYLMVGASRVDDEVEIPSHAAKTRGPYSLKQLKLHARKHTAVVVDVN